MGKEEHHQIFIKLNRQELLSRPRSCNSKPVNMYTSHPLSLLSLLSWAIYTPASRRFMHYQANEMSNPVIYSLLQGHSLQIMQVNVILCFSAPWLSCFLCHKVNVNKQIKSFCPCHLQAGEFWGHKMHKMHFLKKHAFSVNFQWYCF